MKGLKTTIEIEHALSVMLYNYEGNRIQLHGRCDITREKENTFFPIREVVAREGVVICRCFAEDLSPADTARKPVWCEFTVKEQQKIHEAVKQEYYQRRFGDFAFRIHEMGKLMRSAIMKMGRLGEKVKFTESEAPRFFYDGGWREVVELQFPDDDRHCIMAGWHDDRCSNKGVNARIALSCLPMECQQEFFVLMARRWAASHI